MYIVRIFGFLFYLSDNNHRILFVPPTSFFSSFASYQLNVKAKCVSQQQQHYLTRHDNTSSTSCEHENKMCFCG